VKKSTLAALYPIARMFGGGAWGYRDVSQYLSGPALIVSLHHGGYVVCVSRKTKKNTTALWRLSHEGLAVAQVPSIYEEEFGEYRILGVVERTVLAGWRAAQDRPFLSRDLPEWARPKRKHGPYIRQVGNGGLSNQAVWQLSEEGVALGRRLDKTLREQQGETTVTGATGEASA